MAQPSLEPVPVTFVSSHAQLGGSERYLELLLQSLDPAWVRGVVLLEHGPFLERLRSSGYPLHVVPTAPRAGILRSAVRLRRILTRQRPGVVHANGIKAALVAIIATSGSSLPVVWAKHDFSWDGWLGRFVAARAAEVVAVSAAAATALDGRVSTPVVIVAPAIPLPRVDRARSRSLVTELVGCDPRGPVTCMVGRLHPAKGQLELIEIAPRVLERHPEARFCVLGDEDPHERGYERMLRDRAEELGVAAAILFTGHRDDAVTIIGGCDVLVAPSVPDERGTAREGFGLAGVEAMAVGTPVVAYAHGGIPEALGDCGVLVPTGDRSRLGQAVIRVIEDAELRERMIACGDARVREHDPARMAGLMAERYVATARR